jgi:hypothetical protein
MPLQVHSVVIPLHRHSSGYALARTGSHCRPICCCSLETPRLAGGTLHIDRLAVSKRTRLARLADSLTHSLRRVTYSDGGHQP